MKNSFRNRKNIKFYAIAVICITAFFMQETMIFKGSEVEKAIAEKEWKQAKAKRSDKLAKVKELAIGTKEYEEYKVEQTKTKKAYDKLTEITEDAKFMKFLTLQQFLGEFGVFLGLFIYSLSNYIIVRIKKTETVFGESVMHITILYVSLYYIRWCFMDGDYRNLTYYITNLFCVIAVLFSVFLLLKSFSSNTKVAKLIRWILFITDEHYLAMASKALANENEDPKEIERQVNEFEEETARVILEIVGDKSSIVNNR
ncbi:hypothetical protein [Pontimicrobium sp. MEBiC06410]